MELEEGLLHEVGRSVGIKPITKAKSQQAVRVAVEEQAKGRLIARDIADHQVLVGRCSLTDHVLPLARDQGIGQPRVRHPRPIERRSE